MLTMALVPEGRVEHTGLPRAPTRAVRGGKLGLGAFPVPSTAGHPEPLTTLVTTSTGETRTE